MARRTAQTRTIQRERLRIDVAWRVRTVWRAEALLRRVAAHAAQSEGFRDGTLSIAVVGAATMSRLHLQHTGIPGPTDVLTFDLATATRGARLDGEVVVCADVARREAEQRRTASSRNWLAAARAELALYVVHGVLHLAGYDDKSTAAARRMHRREDELLQELRLGRVYEGRR